MRRFAKGLKGEPKGGIKMNPEEIGEIIRKVYGKIYKGNVDDPEEIARRYMEEYKDDVFKAPLASTEGITGSDLRL